MHRAHVPARARTHIEAQYLDLILRVFGALYLIELNLPYPTGVGGLILFQKIVKMGLAKFETAPGRETLQIAEFR
jgi:hypothetical protein